MRGLRIGASLFLLMSYIPAFAGHHARATAAGLPEAAEPGVSAVLGRDLPEYYAQPLASGFEARNPRQRFTVDFDSEGLKVSDGNSDYGIVLRAYGYGDILKPVTHSLPRADRNRIEYERGALSEWYVNGPAGLEQGFTLQQAPSRASRGPLTIELSLAGGLTAAVDKSGTWLVLSNSQEHTTLRYSGLSARDANGKELRSWLEVQDRKLLVRVSDDGAHYPLVIDPTIKQAKLLASDGEDGGHLGYSVAISGNTLVVGSPYANVGSNSGQGAAYVFVKPANGGWVNATENAKLISSDGLEDDNFGYSVAINGDQIAVGAPDRTTVGGVTGGAYFFLKPIGGWTGIVTERVNLGTGKTDLAGYGTSVAVQNYAVIVGAPGDNAAYLLICAKNQPTCGLDATFFGANQGQGNNEFGSAVAISGKSFVVTDPLFTGAQAQFQGAAYVYTNTQGNSFSKATLTASDGALLSEMGISVSISGDTVAVGAPYSTVGNQPAQGAVYVYTKPQGGWVDGTQTAKLTASDGVSLDELGMSVSVSGSSIIAGAPQHLVGFNSQQGAAYAYLKGGGWQNRFENFELTASDGLAFTGFGQSVGISGGTAVVGCPFGNSPHDLPGSAYVFNQ